MIIGIDGNEANVLKRVGIGEYSFELLTQFEEFRVQNLEFRIYLKNKPRRDFPHESERWKYRIVGPKRLWTQFGLPLDLYTHKPRPDVFFTPTHYAPRFSPVPTAISIMDVSYIHFPKLFKRSDLYQLRHWTSYSVKNAKAVFTISNASKNDIINQYNIDSSKVIVTYPGIKMMKSALVDFAHIQKAYPIKSPFILFVGTLQPRKNIARLIEAFSKLKQMESYKDSLQLVVVGKKGWLFEEILDAPSKYHVKNSVLFLDFVPDEYLPSLYQNAVFFAFPSLYEGFGLPVLEAMKYGCPVLTSNISSLPEVGGDAVLYVNPNDTNDIMKKMDELLSNNKLRKDLIEKGYNQVKKFVWEKTARETLEVLEQIVGRGNNKGAM